jgi:membrane glycosyltransferase
VALGVGAWLVSPWLLAWMSPVVLGLALAIPLAALTARRGAGLGLRRLGLLRTPEETQPPDILLRTEALQTELRSGELAGRDGFRRLLQDPALLEVHLAMLPPPRRPGVDPLDPAGLVGMAKLAEACDLDSGFAALTRAEKLAALGSAEAVRRVQALAQSPGR